MREREASGCTRKEQPFSPQIYADQSRKMITSDCIFGSMKIETTVLGAVEQRRGGEGETDCIIRLGDDGGVVFALPVGNEIVNQTVHQSE